MNTIAQEAQRGGGLNEVNKLKLYLNKTEVLVQRAALLVLVDWSGIGLKGFTLSPGSQFWCSPGLFSAP